MGYKLFYEINGSSESPTILVISGSNTSVDVTGLQEYTLYEFQVLAFTSFGDGPKSPVLIERTLEDGKNSVTTDDSYAQLI